MVINQPKHMRKLLHVASLAALFLGLSLASATLAAGPEYQGFGLPGPSSASKIQLDELRVTYRFDQMGRRGKAQDAVPVQTTYKFHNPGATQTLDIGVPLPSANGKLAELTTVYVNGKEVRPGAPKTLRLQNTQRDVTASVVTVTIFENSDLILDLRGNQPVEKLEFPFAISTGAGWDGSIQSGVFEAVMPYDAANWNLSLRKRDGDTMLPLAYSGRAATWSFNDLKIEVGNDVYWTIADPSAMEYYARGNQRYRDTQGDAESYSMMRNALLDMVPCGDVRMPLSTWWNSVYDTVTTGYLTTQYTDGMERLAKSLDLWSDGWNIPHGDDAACQAMRQRPDRYRHAVKSLMAMPSEQLSANAKNALTRHYRFLRDLVKANSPESKIQTGDADPLNDQNLTDKDRSVLAQWDERFGSITSNASTTAAAPIAGFWNKIKASFPKLSLRTQIALFVILALLVLIGIALIAFGWKEKDEFPKDSGRRTPDHSPISPPSVFKPGPSNKPLYDRPTSVSGPMFGKPPAPKSEDKMENEPQSGLGMGFKKPEHPTPPPVPKTEPPKPPEVKSTPPPVTAPPIGMPPKPPTPPSRPPLTANSTPMPWEQPVKLESVAKEQGAPPTVRTPNPPNTQPNTKPNQPEHKNGPTIKI